ncbi:hypothetical protein [uncultured Photobacterium sp.]|uniref:hypothetical protein n=1 Tax=uncultured Photobacterium sp. TaxID=173973 RepID=UPI0026373376|nr:hypothetical protein [uncultured Photobacterium sp.]
MVDSSEVMQYILMKDFPTFSINSGTGVFWELRNSDSLGRWGGEEFMIICFNTALYDAVKIAERLYKAKLSGRNRCIPNTASCES